MAGTNRASFRGMRRFRKTMPHPREVRNGSAGRGCPDFSTDPHASIRYEAALLSCAAARSPRTDPSIQSDVIDRSSSGRAKTAQGVAMPRKACSPKGISAAVVSAATAPEISTLRPRVCTALRAG